MATNWLTNNFRPSCSVRLNAAYLAFHFSEAKQSERIEFSCPIEERSTLMPLLTPKVKRVCGYLKTPSPPVSVSHASPNPVTHQVEAFLQSTTCIELCMYWANDDEASLLQDCLFPYLTQATQLEATHCNLANVSPQLKHLTSLEQIVLSGNQIEQLPDVFASFPRLRSLEIDQNKLTLLPPSILTNVSCDYPAVPISSLEGNPFLCLPSIFYHCIVFTGCETFIAAKRRFPSLVFDAATPQATHACEMTLISLHGPPKGRCPSLLALCTDVLLREVCRVECDRDTAALTSPSFFEEICEMRWAICEECPPVYSPHGFTNAMTRRRDSFFNLLPGELKEYLVASATICCRCRELFCVDVGWARVGVPHTAREIKLKAEAKACTCCLREEPHRVAEHRSIGCGTTRAPSPVHTAAETTTPTPGVADFLLMEHDEDEEAYSWPTCSLA